MKKKKKKKKIFRKSFIIRRLSVWQNRSLAYKIVRFQKNTPLPGI